MTTELAVGLQGNFIGGEWTLPWTRPDGSSSALSDAMTWPWTRPPMITDLAWTSPSTSAPAETTTLRSTRIFPSSRPLTRTSSSPERSPTIFTREPMTVAAGDEVGLETVGGAAETRSGGAGEPEGAGEGEGAGVSGLPKKAKGYLRKLAV